jgi:hypothetical protein
MFAGSPAAPGDMQGLLTGGLLGAETNVENEDGPCPEELRPVVHREYSIRCALWYYRRVIRTPRRIP